MSLQEYGGEVTERGGDDRSLLDAYPVGDVARGRVSERGFPRREEARPNLCSDRSDERGRGEAVGALKTRGRVERRRTG
jgi:hypothetical protein